MKPAITTFLILLLSFCSCLFFPWWSIALVAFIVSALIPQKPWIAFLCGFIALFLLWGGLSFWISANNDHILAQRISLLIFKTGNSFLLIAVTALIGALVAGFGALTGSFVKPVKAIVNNSI